VAPVQHNQAVRERYDELAQRYDQRWAAYIGSSVRQTLARLNVSPGESVLDVGCGTGALERQLGDAVVGIDLSERMLARASGERVAGDALTLPFGDETFDAVASISVLHYWVEPVRVLREMRRVMRVGARLVLTDCDDYLACRICDRVLRLRHADGYARAYGSRELRQLIESAGYATVAVDTYKIGWLWGLMTATATA
jgi:ubiquinone/menaquinone biosynthesis C-methylase UbiE